MWSMRAIGKSICGCCSVYIMSKSDDVWLTEVLVNIISAIAKYDYDSDLIWLLQFSYLLQLYHIVGLANAIMGFCVTCNPTVD